MTDVSTTSHWRVFLYALAEEVDTQGGIAARDELLRGVGRRMAKLRPILSVSGIDLLATEINEQLSTMGWGSVSLRTDDEYPALLIIHTGLPWVGAIAEPPGTWLSAVLEGLYQGWLSQLPTNDVSMVVRRESVTARTVTLHYSRRTVGTSYQMGTVRLQPPIAQRESDSHNGQS